jgi:pimeloyl-ACP methyl ester carboxylesterase
MVFDPAVVTEDLIQTRLKLAMDPDILSALRKMYSRAGLEMLVKQMSGSEGTPPWASLAKIQCPTLLVWGRDDKVSPIDMALLPMRLIPKCELHTFYDCGHWVMIERKAQFENVVLAFLTRD